MKLITVSNDTWLHKITSKQTECVKIQATEVGTEWPATSKSISGENFLKRWITRYLSRIKRYCFRSVPCFQCISDAAICPRICRFKSNRKVFLVEAQWILHLFFWHTVADAQFTVSSNIYGSYYVMHVLTRRLCLCPN